MRTLIHFINPRATLSRLGALLAAAALLGACVGIGSAPEAETTTIYFLRHAEPDFKDPDRPLNHKGRARAEKLVAHFAGTPITHVYASHTDRTRDTVTPLAQARGIAVRQFPPIGNELDGKIVGNRTDETAAIKPLIAALKALPSGSTAVVAGNGANLYPVLGGMGAPANSACTVDRSDCLPCFTRKSGVCIINGRGFDGKKFDSVWRLTLPRDAQATLSRTTYGG